MPSDFYFDDQPTTYTGLPPVLVSKVSSETYTYDSQDVVRALGLPDTEGAEVTAFGGTVTVTMVTSHKARAATRPMSGYAARPWGSAFAEVSPAARDLPAKQLVDYTVPSGKSGMTAENAPVGTVVRVRDGDVWMMAGWVFEKRVGTEYPWETPGDSDSYASESVQAAIDVAGFDLLYRPA